MEDVLNISFSSNKLKSKEEIDSLINSLVKNINEDNLMNVKSELYVFYDNLFNIQKNELIHKILERSIKQFGEFQLTKQKMGEQIQQITEEEITDFKKRVVD